MHEEDQKEYEVKIVGTLVDSPSLLTQLRACYNGVKLIEL